MSVDDRPMESPLPDSSSDLPPDSDTSPADRKRVSGTLPGSSSVFPASITTADVGNSFADRDLPVTDNGLVVARAGIGNDAERGNSNSSGETALTTDDPDIRARISSIAEVINPGAVRSHEPPVERTVPGPGSGSDSETMAVPTPPAVPVSEDALRAGMLPAGTVLGHFVITQYIGGGGMGRVYLATDSALDRKVAIKVLPRQRVNDPGVVARFMNEARSAARLNHEHIAQVYFAGEQNGVPFIAFEYVEGTNIRTLVEEYGLFPLPQAVNFLIQIAHALVHAGSHGVVHRDVKPSNILITNEGRAKLIDMGLARLLNPSETKEDLTASGVTLGTFDYISPEQARDPRNADIRSDIYSLGCTFFFMLTGRPPFPEGTVLQKLLQHQGDIPPDVREFQPEIPIEVAQLIQKMMAKDPRQRFQTPGTLIDALVVIAEMLGLRPTGPGRIIWVPRPPTRSPRLFIHLPWISTAVLLVIAAFLFNLDGYDHGDLAMPDFASFLSEEESNPAATRDGLPGNGSPGASDERKTGTAHYASDDNSMRESPMRDSGAGSPLPSPAVLSGLFGIDGTPNRFPLLQRLLGTDTPPGNTNDRLALRVPDPGTPTRFALCARPVSFELGGIPSKTGRDVSIHRAIVHPISYRRSDKVIDPRSDEMAVVSRKTLVVDPEGASSESYRTLEAAVAAVDTIATKDRRVTIELRTNQTLFTNPFTIAGGSLAITAAPGFSPTLKFGPGESGLAYSDRSMITIGDGELLLRNIAVEFRVPQEIAVSRWTLFEILDAATLTLERCLVTIRNTSGDSSNETATFHQEVAFFRSVVPPLDFEFFHGPFEITDTETSFLVYESDGKTRPLDERAITFLKKYGRKVKVLDVKNLGLNVLEDSVSEYFSGLLINNVIGIYNQELAVLRNHPLSTRRYMWQFAY